MITIKDIPEERAVELCFTAKIKRDFFEISGHNVFTRGALETELVRHLQKDLDKMWDKEDK